MKKRRFRDILRERREKAEANKLELRDRWEAYRDDSMTKTLVEGLQLLSHYEDDEIVKLYPECTFESSILNKVSATEMMCKSNEDVYNKFKEVPIADKPSPEEVLEYVSSLSIPCTPAEAMVIHDTGLPMEDVVGRCSDIEVGSDGKVISLQTTFMPDISSSGFKKLTVGGDGSKLSDLELIELCRGILTGENNIELGLRFKVTSFAVSAIRARCFAKHITESDEFRDATFPRSNTMI